MNPLQLLFVDVHLLWFGELILLEEGFCSYMFQRHELKTSFRGDNSSTSPSSGVKLKCMFTYAALTRTSLRGNLYLLSVPSTHSGSWVWEMKIYFSVKNIFFASTEITYKYLENYS